MSNNPFIFGNPIRDTSLFFNRKPEIRQITNRILSSAHESSSIVGEGRMGSTSLLKMLQNPAVAIDLGLSPDSFCLVYVDFQGTDLTPLHFWQRVLHAIARSLKNEQLVEKTRELSNQPRVDLFDLEDHFECLNESGITTALFMDEFENIAGNINFPIDFFGGLRALAMHYSVALIPATRHELVDLQQSEEIKGSPFFNIFANVILTPLPEDDVDVMLDTYLDKGGLSYTTDDKNFIASLGGGHPYLLQVAGYHWYEARMEGYDGRMQFDTVMEKAYDQVESHFRDMCSVNSEAENTLLWNALNGSRDKNSLQPVMEQLGASQNFLRSLLRRGLLIKKGDAISFVSPLFEKYIQLHFQNHDHHTSVFFDQAIQTEITQQDIHSAYDAFISYSTIDRQRVDEIVSDLERRGLHCWIAPRDIKPGTSYGQAIIKAINESKCMLVAFSSNSNISDQVIQEVERAVSKRLPIIPIRLENAIPSGAMELFLSSRQWLDMHDVLTKIELDQLAETIKAISKK